MAIAGAQARWAGDIVPSGVKASGAKPPEADDISAFVK